VTDNGLAQQEPSLALGMMARQARESSIQARASEASQARGERSWGDFVCGHRVPWHRLTGAFVACNRRHLKSWVGNSSEGPY
jgi:hypothetical protein